MSDGPGIYIYRDTAGEWRWSLLASNNKIVADSGEGYEARAGAQAAVARVQALLQDPRLHVHDERPGGR